MRHQVDKVFLSLFYGTFGYYITAIQLATLTALSSFLFCVSGNYLENNNSRIPLILSKVTTTKVNDIDTSKVRY